MNEPTSSTPPPPGVSGLRRVLHALIARLHGEVRVKLIRCLRAQRAALAALRGARPAAPSLAPSRRDATGTAPSGRYVLMENHTMQPHTQAALLRIWRRLLTGDPGGRGLPHLVLATRTDRLGGDVLQQLRNCDFLEGRIVVIEPGTQNTLAALRQGCLFRLASMADEGATGEGEIVTFDPDDVSGACRIVRARLDR